MTFLASDGQKAFFTMQKSQIQFEQSLIANRALLITKNMDQYSADAGAGADLSRDNYYLGLQQEEEFLSVRKDNLESQIALLDQQISGLKTLVNNNIKNGSGLNLLGG